jgi:hypothetical protein
MVTREEYRRLADEHLRTWQTKELRDSGKSIADDTSLEDLGRLWRIVRLQKKGADIPDSASLAEVERLESLRNYFTKVVGVSRVNRDGTSRQEIIARCRQWEEVRFVPEVDNPVDANAIAVVRANGEQIGYLRQNLAEVVADCMKDGWRYFPIIKAILSDGVASHDLGVVLLVIGAASALPMNVVEEYAEKVFAKVRREG